MKKKYIPRKHFYVSINASREEIQINIFQKIYFSSPLLCLSWKNALLLKMLSVERFIPKYPNIFKFEDPLMNPYQSKDFNDVIVSKKEFAELKLPRVEKLARKGAGEKYNHQKIVTRFMSSVTPYNELLLFHEMGTGKTCTAISAIEELRYTKNRSIKGALVAAKGVGLLKNFVQELLFSCTDGRYVPENYDKLSDLERVHRVRKITSEFYSFHTFETFAKELFKMTDQAIAKKYSNMIFVVDEVHNLRDTSSDTNSQLVIYKQFHRLFHVVRESKVLLMSGTVMQDDPVEFASVMNLILPIDKQLPTEKNFLKTYFDENGNIRNVSDLATKCKGRISYLKAMASDVKKVFIGEKMGSCKHFVTYPTVMSDFQTAAYIDAYERDKIEKSIFTNSRQASLFVFPDGSYGSAGFEKYVTKKKMISSLRGGATSSTTYTLTKELTQFVNKNLANLKKCSDKYAAAIELLLENPKTKILVYSEYVNGSGCIVFSKLLEEFGFKRANGNETTKHPRYAILTTQTANARSIQKLINRFNSPDNVDGEYISVVIGSKVISEGYTFRDVRKEFIFTPHWNYSDTSQVIARGWRLGSHDELMKRGEDVEVKIYQMVSIPRGDVVPSIDLEMYETSEKKDVMMKQIEYVAKVSAFDCPLTIDRNKVQQGLDGSRECDYKDCDYKCRGKISSNLDYSTYDLYYDNHDVLKNKLQEYFKIHDEITFEELVSMFAIEASEFEIVGFVRKMIYENTPVLNSYGLNCYVRFDGNVFFLTTDIGADNDAALEKMYSSKVIVKGGVTFDRILKELGDRKIPDLIDNIFKHPSYAKSILLELPDVVQKELLQASILAEILDVEKNKNVRRRILDIFKNFYTNLDGEWYVWLHKGILGISVLSGNRWISSKNTARVEKYIQEKRSNVGYSPIGYYGLINPLSNEFCLKDVDVSDVKETDLRKLKIGRRCTDWDMGMLLDIIVRKIKMAPFIDDDVDEYVDLKKLVSENRYAKLPQDVQNIETMKRFVFWVKQSRTIICENIMKWMEANDLLEDSFDCGTQQKKRKLAG